MENTDDSPLTDADQARQNATIDRITLLHAEVREIRRSREERELAKRELFAKVKKMYMLEIAPKLKGFGVPPAHIELVTGLSWQEISAL